MLSDAARVDPVRRDAPQRCYTAEQVAGISAIAAEEQVDFHKPSAAALDRFGARVGELYRVLFES